MRYYILNFRQQMVEYSQGIYYPLNKVVDFYDLLEQVLSPNYCETTSELVDINFSCMKHEEYSTYEIAIVSMDFFVSNIHEHIVAMTGEKHNYKFSTFLGHDVIIGVESISHKDIPSKPCVAELTHQEAA
jgi:hypothetical protein